MPDQVIEIVVLSECSCTPGEPAPGAGLPTYFENPTLCARDFAKRWQEGKRKFATHLNNRHVIGVGINRKYHGHWD